MENENIKKKEVVKGKIILFVIGALVGAIISTATFFIYTKTLGVGSNVTGSSSRQMPGGGTPPEMPSGENGPNGQGGTPPEMQNNTNSSQSNS